MKPPSKTTNSQVQHEWWSRQGIVYFFAAGQPPAAIKIGVVGINAPQVIGLYAEALAKTGRELPPARALDAIRNDPVFAEDLRENMVALIPAPETLTAAE